MPPCAADLTAEAVQSQQVRRNCMVREVAIQDPLKPLADDGHGFVPTLVELVRIAVSVARIRFLAVNRTTWNLPCRSVPQQWRESQKVERLRPALPPLAPPFRRKSAKLDQRVLSGCKRQPELGQPFLQLLPGTLAPSVTFSKPTTLSSA